MSSTRAEYWIDGQNKANGGYASTHLDDLGPGFHWLGVLVKGLANQQLGICLWSRDGCAYSVGT